MISIIVAFDVNRVIGTANNTIPWHLPDDMKFFKRITTGYPIIMGKNTWQSLPIKPLPNRLNIVVSKSMRASNGSDTFKESEPVVVRTIKEAIGIVNVLKMPNAFIIGGSQVYKSALDQDVVDRLIITHVRGSHQGNVYFPDLKDYGFVKHNVIMKHREFDIIEYTKHVNSKRNS